jgi:hypothetical protein
MAISEKKVQKLQSSHYGLEGQIQLEFAGGPQRNACLQGTGVKKRPS